MSRMSRLAYAVQHEPDTLTADERETVEALRREAAQRARNGSLDRAQAQAALGNVPALIATELLRDALREAYRVMSRTTDGVAYHVELLHDRAGVVTTLCDCPAATSGKCCWHRGAARLGHAGAIPVVVECGYRFRVKAQAPAPAPRRALAPVTAAELSGKRVAS